MPIRRFWIVSALDLINDNQARELGLVPNNGRAVPRRANLQFNNDEQGQDAGVPVVAAGGDIVGLKLERKQAIDIIFVTQDQAESYAKTQAEKQPTKPFGVFTCVGIFETKEPQIIRKEFNQAHEVVMTKDE